MKCSVPYVVWALPDGVCWLVGLSRLQHSPLFHGSISHHWLLSLGVSSCRYRISHQILLHRTLLPPTWWHVPLHLWLDQHWVTFLKRPQILCSPIAICALPGLPLFDLSMKTSYDLRCSEVCWHVQWAPCLSVYCWCYRTDLNSFLRSVPEVLLDKGGSVTKWSAHWVRNSAVLVSGPTLATCWFISLLSRVQIFSHACK